MSPVYSRFRPEDFLKISEEIDGALETRRLELEDDVLNAWIRTGISRAYYAAFLFINYGLNFLYSGKDAHQQLVTDLKSMGGIYREIGVRLESLRSKRRSADYEISYLVTPKDLKWVVSTAREAIKKGKTILQKRRKPPYI